MPLLSLLFRRRGKLQVPYAVHEKASGPFGQVQEAGIRYVKEMRAEEMKEEGERNLHKEMQKKEAEKLREILKSYGFEPENIQNHIEKLRTLKSLYEAGFRIRDARGVIKYAREQLGIEEASNEKMLAKIRAIISDPSIAPLLG